MRKSVIALFIYSAFMAAPSWGVQGSAELVEFDDLPKLVSQRNQHVSGARLKSEASERLTGHLTRSYLPTLEAHVGGESFTTGYFGSTSQPFGTIDGRVNLFRGGRDLLEERVREAQADVSKAAFEQIRLEELTKARRAYWELVYKRELIALIKEALKQNEANLAAANKRIRAGLATSTDRIEFEIYRVQLEQDLARVTLGSTNSQRALNVLIGRPEDTVIETVGMIPHQHDAALVRDSLDTSLHRDVRALAASGDAAMNQKRQADRWWTPSFDIYANYSLYTLREREYEALSDRYETVAGVRLSFTLFDGFQAQASGASFGLQAEGYSQQAGQTARELSAHFESAKQELKLTHELIHTAEQSVEKGAEYLKRTQVEYARGVKNSPDVFSATEKYVDLKRRYAEIRRDYQIAKADLLAMLGK